MGGHHHHEYCPDVVQLGSSTVVVVVAETTVDEDAAYGEPTRTVVTVEFVDDVDAEAEVVINVVAFVEDVPNSEVVVVEVVVIELVDILSVTMVSAEVGIVVIEFSDGIELAIWDVVALEFTTDDVGGGVGTDVVVTEGATV